jgi:hypothetical protein
MDESLLSKQDEAHAFQTVSNTYIESIIQQTDCNFLLSSIAIDLEVAYFAD